MFDIGIQYNIHIIYTLFCFRAPQMGVLDPLMTGKDITYWTVSLSKYGKPSQHKEKLQMFNTLFNDLSAEAFIAVSLQSQDIL